MNFLRYENEKTHQISFPLGGIGTGCIGLAGNGRFIDAEIFGRPNKGSHLGFTHFAVKAERSGELIDARVLNSDLPPPYMGAYNRPHFQSYGFGPDRASMAGFPHFKNLVFEAAFPLAKLHFDDPSFPGKVTLCAFNPFIPLNDRDSSIPGAFFTIEILNESDEDLDYTIALSASNLYSGDSGLHTEYKEDGISVVKLSSGASGATGTEGDMSIATDSDDADCQLYWYRGNWFDNLSVYWSDFAKPGKMPKRDYSGAESAYRGYTNQDVATLTASLRIPAGKSAKTQMVLTWNTPNAHNYWNPEVAGEATCEAEATSKATGKAAGETDCGCDDPNCSPTTLTPTTTAPTTAPTPATAAHTPTTPTTHISPSTWKHYYATLYKDSSKSAIYALKNFNRLYSETEGFTQALMSSSLPSEALEAVSANLAVIKSPTCLRLQDGSLYGFEGCHCDSGCCEGSCTHVWAYTYAIPFLFPALERSMRRLEYTNSLDKAGGMSFRLMLPIGREKDNFRPCVDGQYATVLRVLREYKISGDKPWLNEIWPYVKRSIEFAWSPDNEDRWDFNKTGIMDGRQHHTLDMELFGESAWLSGMYLAGLAAGAELAEIMGEHETAKHYAKIFEKGKAYLNRELFNGEYYFQRVDVRDKSILDPYAAAGKSLQGQDIYTAYWSEEKGEILYQIGNGCGIDQVLAQWHANLIGLGEVFEKEKVKSALSAIYRYNFMENARDHVNPCRLYCLNDESGLLMCSWPKKEEKPAIPVPYAEETMHGFEYQAAIHMIQEGMIEQGLSCIRGVRDRYDGEKRNPWNEIECGNNYARSMSSYALLLTYSGFRYDIPNGLIGFAPLERKDEISFFWSLEGAWGNVCFTREKAEIFIKYGGLRLCRIQIKNRFGTAKQVICDDKECTFTVEDDDIMFKEAVSCSQQITIYYS